MTLVLLLVVGEQGDEVLAPATHADAQPGDGEQVGTGAAGELLDDLHEGFDAAGAHRRVDERLGHGLAPVAHQGLDQFGQRGGGGGVVDEVLDRQK
ncbi:hypothetical protein [Saccharothrix luteola]|uniref:hypothetical protein n=1 Tax=Saccharothrix luteola TaxID=2893018 RepID=UPI001E4BD5C0|nr:hypothetical protein [Saccharothrix luteola]